VFFGGDAGSPDTFQKFYADVEMYANNFDGTDPEPYLASTMCDKIPPTRKTSGRARTSTASATRPMTRWSLELSKTADMAKRAEIAKKLNDMLTKDSYVVVPLVDRGRLSAHSNTLGGVVLNTWDTELWNAAGLVPREVIPPVRGPPIRPRNPGPAFPLPGGRSAHAYLLTYTLRRLLLAIPTLLVISLVIFLLVDLAPGSPDVRNPADRAARGRQKMIEALGLTSRLGSATSVAEAVLLGRAADLIDALVRHRFAEGAARIILADAQPGDSDHRRAPAADPDVIGTAYLVGILIACADRHLFRLPAVQLVRPGRHLRRDDRLFGADLLHRHAADHHLRGLAGLVPDHLRHHAGGDGLGQLPATGQARWRCR
jgi:hypothetical protein